MTQENSANTGSSQVDPEPVTELTGEEPVRVRKLHNEDWGEQGRKSGVLCPNTDGLPSSLWRPLEKVQAEAANTKPAPSIGPLLETRLGVGFPDVSAE